MTMERRRISSKSTISIFEFTTHRSNNVNTGETQSNPIPDWPYAFRTLKQSYRHALALYNERIFLEEAREANRSRSPRREKRRRSRERIRDQEVEEIERPREKERERDRDRERKRRRSESRDREREPEHKRERRERCEKERGEGLEYIKTDDGAEIRIKEEPLDDYPDHPRYQSTQPYDQTNVKYEEDDEKKIFEPDNTNSSNSRHYDDYEEGEAY